MKEYNLNFNGYWIESRISGLPKTSGVYIVYRCTYEDNGVCLKEILYIGQATDLHTRINTHDKKEVFNKECKGDEVLCYSFAEVSQEDLDIVEHALIFAQKPKLNENNKDKFEHLMPVAFILEGRCKLMKFQNFTIKEK